MIRMRNTNKNKPSGPNERRKIATKKIGKPTSTYTKIVESRSIVYLLNCRSKNLYD